MDAFRYYLALFVVAAFPGAILGWLVVHAFVATWRRLGPATTYLMYAGLVAATAAGLYAARAILLAIEFGWNVWTTIAAALSYGIAVYIEMCCRRHLKFPILIGLPELSPASREQRLLQEGIYGRIRHPRYLGLLFGLLAAALFSNYLMAYVLVAAAGVGFYWVTVLEEQELVGRFGAAYRDYQRRVPRFIPARTGPDDGT